MSYIPTEWKSGDVVTSEKLNKLENGVASAGGVFIIGVEQGGMQGIYVMDKTFAEIAQAHQTQPVFVRWHDETTDRDEWYLPTLDMTGNPPIYQVTVNGSIVFETSSMDEYPVYNGATIAM